MQTKGAEASAKPGATAHQNAWQRWSHGQFNDRSGSDSVIRRRRLNVRFAGKRTRLSDLRVRALISATAPPLRSVARPRPRRPAESRQSPTPATVSIAVAGVSPRRGRSSALARSISIKPKKEGPGGGSIFGRVPQDRVRACPRFFEFATGSRAFSGVVLEVSTTRGQGGSPGGPGGGRRKCLGLPTYVGAFRRG
jgi:hypothetical protein